MIPNEPTITPELVAEHGLKPEEYERILELIGREPTLHRARHLLGDVERALLVQVLQGASAHAADQGAVGDPGAGRERRRDRHRRRARGRVQDGEPQPPELHRALSGRGDRRRRHPARRVHHGRAADRLPQCAVLRRSQPSEDPAPGRPAWSPASAATAIRSACRRSAAQVRFHTRYDGNSLVNAMAVGLAETDKIFYAAASGVGMPIVYLGSKTGRDGIHGATMASAEFGEDAEEKRPTVQVGDPFSEKLLLEACLEIMAKGCVIAIQDMGAAGLTCSAVEMGAKGDLGVDLDLDKVPCRETGMSAYEMMLSESQERMLMVLKPEKEQEAEAIFRKWGLDFAVVGETTPSKRFIVQHARRRDGRPADQGAGRRGAGLRAAVRRDAEAAGDQGRRASSRRCALADALEKLIGSPDLCSKRWVWEQYDHVILGNTVQRPGGDAAVVRVNDGPKALALTADVTPRYCEADPFEGGKQAVAEAWRNITAVGARPLAVTDNLNFGNPERPEIMGQFVGCMRGIAEACKALDFPVVSGNVSLYNETKGRGDPADPDHRRRRRARRFHQVGDACVQGRGRSDPADRRDAGLARPVALSARRLRPRGGRAAAGRSDRGARERRLRARADRRGHSSPRCTTFPTAACWWRSPRWRWPRASAPRSTLRPRTRRRTPSGSARIRPATSSRCRRAVPRRSCERAQAAERSGAAARRHRRRRIDLPGERPFWSQSSRERFEGWLPAYMAGGQRLHVRRVAISAGSVRRRPVAGCHADECQRYRDG